jgi:hypothetical protein
MNLIVTLDINDSEHNDTEYKHKHHKLSVLIYIMLNVVMLIVKVATGANLAAPL